MSASDMAASRRPIGESRQWNVNDGNEEGRDLASRSNSENGHPKIPESQFGVMDRRRVLQASAVGALTLATGGVLAACGSSSGSSTGASGGSGEDVSFGFSHPYSDVPLVALVKELVQKDAEKLGWSVSLDASKGGSLAEQTKTLETWVTQKLTAICAFPPDPTALEALARRATDEGTIWTTYG